MSLRLALGWACLFTIALATAPASAEEPGRYREFTLGSTTASVLELTGSRPSDLKTMHERPSVLKELAWRPRYTPGRALPDVDPVREMVFSFSNDRLYRIAVYYDRTRTAGLTHDDMILALKGVYGAPLASAARAERQERLEPADASMPIAAWGRGDTLVSLVLVGLSRRVRPSRDVPGGGIIGAPRGGDGGRARRTRSAGSGRGETTEGRR